MINSITHLQDYKKVKKVERIIIDLVKVEKLLTTSIKMIGVYKRYAPAKNVLANLLENKALVMVHLKQCKTMLEHYNANKMEDTSKEHSNQN